jgi:hypothetical protein
MAPSLERPLRECRCGPYPFTLEPHTSAFICSPTDRLAFPYVSAQVWKTLMLLHCSCCRGLVWGRFTMTSSCETWGESTGSGPSISWAKESHGRLMTRHLLRKSRRASTELGFWKDSGALGAGARLFGRYMVRSSACVHREGQKKKTPVVYRCIWMCSLP